MMIVDKEGQNTIKLSYSPNKHLVVLGKSGFGKTFAANREIAYRARDGDRAVILDVSGSYTTEELLCAGNVFGNRYQCHNLNEDMLEFPIYSTDPLGTLVDALIEAFGITSYNQEMILSECCEEIMTDSSNEKFSFSELYERLKQHQHKYQSEEYSGSSDMLRNTELLLNKFRHVRKLSNMVFLDGTKHRENNKIRKAVTILQLSDFSDWQKKTLSVFFLSLLWMNAVYRKRHSGIDWYNVVLIDEFQHFSLIEDGTLNAILREGRKINFSVILCSQYLSDHKKAELSALTQAATVLLFRPTENEIKMLINLFNLGEYQTWKRLLLSLDVGEAVLIGCYKLCNGRELKNPLIVSIVDDDEEMYDDAKDTVDDKENPRQVLLKRRRGTVILR